MKRFSLVIAFAASLLAPAHAGMGLHGTTTTVSPYNVLWSPQSLWNAHPVNPVLGGTVVPSYPGSGAFGFNAPFPGSCETVAISSPATPATIDMSFITDEAQARNFSVTNFPSSVPNPAGSCNDVLWDYVDQSTQNLMSFIQFVYSSGTTYTGLNFKSYPIAGTGMPSPTRPSGPRAGGSPAFSGYIRLWEQNNSIFNHALSFSVDQTMLQGANSGLGPKYPFTGTDGDFHAYTGNNFHLGSLLMLPSNFPLASLTSAGAQSVARTLMTYGGYIVDTTGQGTGGFNFNIENNVTLNICGASSNPCTDLQTIEDSLREVMTQDSWVDGNGSPFTPPSWYASGQNILSMRGTPWTANGGGTLPSYGGFFNTIVPDYEFPDTTVTPGSTFTIEGGGYYRSYITSGSWQSWASGDAFYTNPVAGRQYTLAATGTGSGVSLVLQIWSNNFGTLVFTSSSLSAGQSQTFTWPAVTAPGSIHVFLTKTAGPAATIAYTLTPTGPQNYYISNSGSDSNDGMTTSTPWQTFAHANSYTGFVPGDTISCNGGQTFTDPIVPPTGGYLSYPITYNSYGIGQCTIAPSAGNTPGITLTNLPFVEFHNLIVTGQSATTDNADGILILNNQGSNTKLDDVIIQNVTVSNFAKSCIHVSGNNGTSGFNRFVVANNTLTSCTGVSSSSGNAGIYVESSTGYGSGISAPSHTNGVIHGNTISSMTGATSQTNTGSGVIVAECASCVVKFNTIHDNGASSLGSYGVLMYDGTANSMWNNIVYNQKTTTTAGGGAYDLDGGMTNSLMQFNYGVNNQGACLSNIAFNDTHVTTWNNNQTSNNICQNNGSANNLGELDIEAGSTMTNVYDFNNTLFNSGGSSCLVNIVGSETGYILDNIFDGASTHIICSTVNTALVFNANDYYNAGSAVAFSWNGTSYASFSAWQTATTQEEYPPGGGSIVGLTANPVFVSPGGGTTSGPGTAYELRTTSTMLGGGKNITDFNYGDFAIFQLEPHDYYGNVLPQFPTAWDVGSYSGAGVP